MNSKKAKFLRKLVYGDLSLRTGRKYMVNKLTGQVINDPSSLRGLYLKLKRSNGAIPEW